MHLQERVGHLSGTMAQVLVREEATEGRYGNRLEAQQEAVAESQGVLEEELVDCLTCLLSLANRLGVDLESAYLRRIGERSLGDAAELPAGRGEA